MNKKLGPYFLLIFLIIVLVFVFGVRYGQKVEKTNKVINYVLSLPPTKPAAPTSSPLEFITYKSTGCRIQFLYPSTLHLEKESSYSAQFTKDKIVQLSVNCEKEHKFIFPVNVKIATEEMKFQSSKVTTQLFNNMRYFQVQNRAINKPVSLQINQSLMPLIEKSLEFINK